MSRRTHKKSKNGCLECKRRHIRCDENHPACANCGAAELQCSFLYGTSPLNAPVFVQVPPSVAASSRASTAASTPPSMLWPEHSMGCHELPDPYQVNMTHLQLYSNLSSEEFLSIEDLERPDTIPTSIYMKYAGTSSCLMHVLLAGSAFHLSTKTTGGSRDMYREYATGLQNRALSLFNESNPVLEVTPANCVLMFLFSSTVGVHLLCDTLHYYRDSLAGFIDRFAHCFSLYRGVRAVIDQCWHLLLKTELGPRLGMAHLVMVPTGIKGSDFDTIRDLVNKVNIPLSSQEAYQDATSHLQQVFDVQRAAPGRKIRVPVVFAWPILVSPEYVDLLRQRQPIALIILAHYAIMLHRGRDLWLMGGGGRFLIESICESLGSEWQEWLKLPKAALHEDLT